MIDFFFYKLGLTPAVLAGISLWSLALYLSFARFNDRLVDLFCTWLNETDRRLYSEQVLSRRPPGWEERNQLFASVLSTLPSLVAGVVLFTLLSVTLSRSWSVASGLLVSVSAGVYQLGRQDARSHSDRRP